MKIFTTGGIWPGDLDTKGQRVLDELGRYLREQNLAAEDVEFFQTYAEKSVIFTAIVKS